VDPGGTPDEAGGGDERVDKHDEPHIELQGLEARLGAGRVTDDVVNVDAIDVEGIWWHHTPRGCEPALSSRSAKRRAPVGGVSF